jgi:hypothetical protein
MLKLNVASASLACCVLLAACANPRQQALEKDNLLAAAGFSEHVADTPQRVAMLHRLPPHRFVQKERAGQPIYVFADPLVCNCLYVGDAAAYARYRKEVLERQLATEEQIAAESHVDPEFDFGDYDHGHP